jgi:hypothetical protein
MLRACGSTNRLSLSSSFFADFSELRRFVISVSSFRWAEGGSMTDATREQISVAFFNLMAGAADFTATSRRFVHWDQVNETQMPFLTMLKTCVRR